MNKKVALISSFCDTQEKIEVLNQNIKTLKSNALDVIVISPLYLPEETVSLCDHFFYTKDNPVLKWPLNVQIYHVWFYLQNEKYLVLSAAGHDYGWAGLNHIKKLSEIAMSFDYEYFYNLIYDLEIDENVINTLQNPKECSVCSFQRDGSLLKWASLHLIIMNKINAKTFSSLINLESYIEFLNSSGMKSGKDVECFMESITLHSGMKFETLGFAVTDKINIGQDFFNHSKINGLKFFVAKNALDLQSEIKICIYENKNNVKPKVIVNGEEKTIEEDLEIFSIGVNFLDLQSIYIKYENETMDLLPTIKSIKHSLLRSMDSLSEV
jgi:hypothetical protein